MLFIVEGLSVLKVKFDFSELDNLHSLLHQSLLELIPGNPLRFPTFNFFPTLRKKFLVPVRRIRLLYPKRFPKNLHALKALFQRKL